MEGNRAGRPEVLETLAAGHPEMRAMDDRGPGGQADASPTIRTSLLGCAADPDTWLQPMSGRRITWILRSAGAQAAAVLRMGPARNGSGRISTSAMDARGLEPSRAAVPPGAADYWFAAAER